MPSKGQFDKVQGTKKPNKVTKGQGTMYKGTKRAAQRMSRPCILQIVSERKQEKTRTYIFM